MGKYDDAIGSIELKVSVKEVLDEAASNEVDRKLKQKNADREQEVKIKISADDALKDLERLNKAAKDTKKNLENAVSSGKGFNSIKRYATSLNSIKKQIEALPDSIKKNNNAYKESQRIFKETDKILNKLTVTQEKLDATKVDNGKIKIQKEQEKVIESTTKSLARQGEVIQTISDIKDNTFVKNEQMKKSAVEATTAAVKQQAASLDELVKKKEEINKKINEKQYAASVQNDWFEYLNRVLDDNKFKTSGKKAATDQLRYYTGLLTSRRRDHYENYHGEYPVEMTEVSWMKAYIEAQRQNVADSTLNRYSTDAKWDYETNLKTLQESYNLHQQLLDRIQNELGVLQNQSLEIDKQIQKTKELASIKPTVVGISQPTTPKGITVDTSSLTSDSELASVLKGIDINSLTKGLNIEKEKRDAINKDLIDLLSTVSKMTKNQLSGSKDEGVYNTFDEQYSKVIDSVLNSGSYKINNTTDVSRFTEFLNHARTSLIQYTENYKKEFADEWKSIINKFGKGKNKVITKDSTANTINAQWQELTELFPEFFDKNIINEKDRFKQYLDVISQARDAVKGARKTLDVPLASVDRDVVDERLLGIINQVDANTRKIFDTEKKVTQEKENQVNATDKVVKKTKEQIAAEKAAAKAAEDLAKRKEAVGKLLGTGLAEEVSIDEFVRNNVNKSVEQLRGAKNNGEAIINFKGVFSGDDLLNQVRDAIGTITKESNFEVGPFNIKQDSASFKLIDKETGIAVDQVYRLKNATEEIGSSIIEVETKISGSLMDASRIEEQRYNKAISLQNQLYELKKKLAVLNVTNNTTDSESEKARRLTAELQNQYDQSIKLINNENQKSQILEREVQLQREVVKLSVEQNNKKVTAENNTLADLESKMANVSTELDTMGIKLNKVFSVPGSYTAIEAFDNMTEAANRFKAAQTLDAKQNAYNEYTKYQKQFTTEIANLTATQKVQAEAQRESDSALKGYYKSLMTTLQGIDSLDTKINSLKLKDNGTGTFLPLIQDLENQKSQLLLKVNDISKQMKSAFQGSFYQGTNVELPFSNLLNNIGDEKTAGRLKGFFSDARVQAILTEQEIEKLITTLQKSQTASDEFALKLTEKLGLVNNAFKKTNELVNSGAISADSKHLTNALSSYNDLINYKKELDAAGKSDPSKWDGVETSVMMSKINSAYEYLTWLNKVAEKEAQYFAGKTKYGKNTTMSTLAKDTEAQVNKINDAQEKLRNAANKFAKESGASGAIVTNFTQSADGIAKLDFSVLDSGTNSLRKFRMEMGSLTNDTYVTETAVKNSMSGIQAGVKQLESVSNLIQKLNLSGVDTSDSSAAVTNLLNVQQKLNAELSKGTGTSETTITKLANDAKLSVAEVQKLYNQMQKVQSIAKGNGGYKLDGINLNKDAYTEMTNSVKNFAKSFPDSTLSIGKFNEAAGTLDFSLVKANGSATTFKATMESMSGTVAAQRTGVKQVNTALDTFAKTAKHAGRELVTAFVGYNVFFKVVSEIRKGIGYVKQIDLAMTELKKVTDETEETYDNFLKTASKTANVIGSTVSEFTEATANFARLGYSVEESAEMAKSAVVYKNVADGLDTIDESTESIISTMKAFGIESSGTMGIIDRFNEVGKCIAQII